MADDAGVPARASVGASSLHARWLAVLVCGCVGSLLAVMPQLATLVHYGDISFLASNDDAIYLGTARQAYFDDWALLDAVTRPSDHLPTLFEPIVYVPFAKVAAAAHLGVFGIALLWRLTGGFALGASLFVLNHRLTRTLSFSLLSVIAIGIWLLCDPAIVSGRPLVDEVSVVRSIFNSAIWNGRVDVLGQFRFTSPVLVLPALIFFSVFLMGLRESKATGSVIGAVLALAFLIYSYFYYWTAAVTAVALLMVTVFLCRGRLHGWRQLLKRLTFILVGALLLGAPSILQKAQLSKMPQYAEALQRMSRGEIVLPGDPMLRIGLFNSWVALQMFVGLGAIIFWRWYEMSVLVAMVLAGYLLRNSALLTHRGLENWHWSYVHTSLGVVIMLMVFLRLANQWLGGRRSKREATCIAAVLLIIALPARWSQAINAPQPRQYRAELDALRPILPAIEQLKPNDVVAGGDETKIVMMESPCAILYQSPHMLHSSLVGNDELLTRQALSLYLTGYSEADGLRVGAATPFWAAQLVRPMAVVQHVTDRRKELFESIAADPARYIDSFGVTTVITSAPAQAMPAGFWKPVGSGKGLTIWRATRAQ
ncbi:MAG: hypothetical protein JO353_11120 [Phycisphaerae bacterium]|nr:hypothetical protein [Phycisphaerae bacterium]